MKIVKYICDCCKDEMLENEVNEINVPSEIELKEGTSKSIFSDILNTKMQFCKSCLLKVSIKVNRYLDKMIDEIRHNQGV